MIRLVVLLVLALMGSALAQSPSLDNSSAKRLLEKEWRNRINLLPYGPGTIISGPVGPPNDICGSIKFSRQGFAPILAAEQAGLFVIKVDQMFDRFRRDRSYYWDQLLEQTLYGAEIKVVIELSAQGVATDKETPASDRKPNCLRLPLGTMTVDNILRNEPQRRGLNELRVIYFTYTDINNPVYIGYARARGIDIASTNKRKAIVLLKFDPFTEAWGMIAGDSADATEEFQTNFVEKGLASAP